MAIRLLLPALILNSHTFKCLWGERYDPRTINKCMYAIFLQKYPPQGHDFRFKTSVYLFLFIWKAETLNKTSSIHWFRVQEFQHLEVGQAEGKNPEPPQGLPCLCRIENTWYVLHNFPRHIVERWISGVAVSPQTSTQAEYQHQRQKPNSPCHNASTIFEISAMILVAGNS